MLGRLLLVIRGIVRSLGAAFPFQNELISSHNVPGRLSNVGYLGENVGQGLPVMWLSFLPQFKSSG